jgi:hypothetical protein
MVGMAPSPSKKEFFLTDIFPFRDGVFRQVVMSAAIVPQGWRQCKRFEKNSCAWPETTASDGLGAVVITQGRKKPGRSGKRPPRHANDAQWVCLIF